VLPRYAERLPTARLEPRHTGIAHRPASARPGVRVDHRARTE